MPSRRFVIGAALILLLCITGFVSAHEVLRGEDCTIGVDEVISRNVFVLCRTLVIEGRVNGSLIGAATTVKITGQVTGDVYVFAGSLDVYGTLHDDLHFGGGLLHVHNGALFVQENADIFSLSLSTRLDKDVSLPGGVIGLGYQLVIDGSVSRDVTFWGSSFSLSGSVGGDVDATVGDARTEPGWLLETAMSLSEAEMKRPGLNISEQGKVGGALRSTEIVTTVVQPVTGEIGETIPRYFAQMLHEFVTLGLIGVVGLVLLPRALQAPIQNLYRHPFTSLGIGVPAFFIPPVMLFIAAILTLLLVLILVMFGLNDLALVGGLLAGFLSLSSTGLFYFVAIFIARIIVCLAIGQILLRMTLGENNSPRLVFVQLFVGVFSLAVLASLPGIGWVFNALTLVLGLGAILILLQEQIRTIRERDATPRYTYPMSYPGSLPIVTPAPAQTENVLPPPADYPDPMPPGMDDLPEGFRWWDDD